MEKFCYWSLKPIISKWFLCYYEITSAMTTASSSKNTSSLFYCYLQQASNEAKLPNGKKIKREDNNLYYWNTCTQLASKVDLSITAATVPALLWTGWQTTGLSMCCSMTCINLENNLLLYQTDHYGWVARYQSINRLCCSCIFLHLSTRRERHPSTYSCCSLPPIYNAQDRKKLFAPWP